MPEVIVVKDGNRTVSWIYNERTRIDRILDDFERGYRLVKRDTIRLNGRQLLEAHLDCKIRYFFDKHQKFVFQVDTVKPPKKKVAV